MNAFLKRVQKNRYFYLFATLIGLIFFYPFLEGSLFRMAFLNVILSVVLIGSVEAVREKRSNFRTALWLMIPAFISLWLRPFFPDSLASDILYICLSVIFYAFVILVLIRYVLDRRAFSHQKVFAGMCVYLLMGITWAMLYVLIARIKPGAFLDVSHEVLAWNDFIYFSFTTLTTLGYGDIRPVAPYARALSILEAIAGVLYLAVMISRLVGISIHERAKKESPDDSC